MNRLLPGNLGTRVPPRVPGVVLLELWNVKSFSNYPGSGSLCPQHYPYCQAARHTVVFQIP
eukprot:1851799-Rhodomonas_salina.1